MKKALPIAVCLLVLDIAIHFTAPSTVHAQANVGALQVGQVVSSPNQCSWAAGATVTNGVAMCFVNTGTPATSEWLFALNGSTTWTPVAAAATAYTGTAPIVVSGSTISCPTCVAANSAFTATISAQ